MVGRMATKVNSLGLLHEEALSPVVALEKALERTSPRHPTSPRGWLARRAAISEGVAVRLQECRAWPSDCATTFAGQPPATSSVTACRSGSHDGHRGPDTLGLLRLQHR
jgi:hypothetical protein